MLRIKNFFITLLWISVSVEGFAQAISDSGTNSQSARLRDYQQQATELYNGFKNGPAFEMLQQYGELKEKELVGQEKDEINRLESKFKTDFSRRQHEMTEIQKEVDSLKKENDSLEKEKQKLTRNTIIFFVLLVSFLTGILISRIELAKKAKKLEDVSSIQLKRTLKLAEVWDGLTKTKADLGFSFKSIFENSVRSVSLIAKLKSIAINQKKKTDDFQKCADSINRVNEDAERSVSSLRYYELTRDSAAEEKVSTNLNNLINEVFDISFHWIKSLDDSFDCSRTKDLEKILPEISIMPLAIRTALFHFFNNAFYAVYEKKKSAGKSYEPKISVTSRKLPRFVQVRIKDNGAGIDDKILPRIYEPFFTAKPPDQANGLGLSFAAEIIKKKHGGEIIIETEPGKGTDFIVRFPINTPI